MPRGLDAELLGENGDLARGTESAGLRDMHANVIDEALGDQRLPFMRAVEELAHGNGSGAVLPDLPEVGEVFGRKRIFEKEHAERLGRLAELHGQVGGEALVHVVEQFHFLAQFAAAHFEQLECAPELRGGIEERLVVQGLGAAVFLVLRAIAGHTRQADLHADMTPALRHVFLRVVDDFFELGAAGVGVGVGGFPAFSSGELIDRHAGLAALDVPERLVDAADGVVENGAVFPVRAVVAGLPDVFDAVGGFPQQKGLEVFLDRGLDQVGALRERGAAVAVKAVLIGGDFDHGEAHALRFAFDDADVLDARRGQGAGSAGGLFLGGDKARSKGEAAGSGERLQENGGAG